MNESQRQEKLKTLLANESDSNWKTLCRLLEDWPQGPGFKKALKQAEKQLAGWEGSKRRPGLLFRLDRTLAPKKWVEGLLKGDAPPAAWSIVRFVQCYRWDLKDQGVAQLISRPEFRSVTRLHLEGNALTEAAIEHIAESKYTRQLEHLDLHLNAVGDRGAQVLATHPGFKNLQSLGLYRAKIGKKGAKALGASTTLINLRELDLGFNQLTADPLMDVSGLPALEVLQIATPSINSGGLEDAEADHLRNAYLRGLPQKELRAVCKAQGVAFSKVKMSLVLSGARDSRQR